MPAKSRSVVARRGVPMREFSKSLPMALLRAREAVMRRFRPALRDDGVTEQQWRVLRALAHKGPLEVTELARATCLLAPSLSRILPDLESRGLVSRKQSEADARRSTMSLEPKGLRLISQHAPRSEEIYEEIARRFGRERLEELFSLLRELEVSLGAHNQSAATPPKERLRAKSDEQLNARVQSAAGSKRSRR